MIPEAVLSQIQDRSDIVEIISAHVALKRAGRSFKAPCPFHQEKTPSFVVSPDKQIFHCFGCGAGGNVFSFLMKLEKRDFREVVEMLAERGGIQIPEDSGKNENFSKSQSLFVKLNQLSLEFYRRCLDSEEGGAARAYLKKRAIAAETIASFQLGYAPKAWDRLAKSLEGQAAQSILEKSGLFVLKADHGYYDRFRERIVFPILNVKGECIAFGARVLDDTLPKYLNSPESEIYSKGRHLYGLYQAKTAIRQSDAAFVVEGYMDVIACHQAGVQNVVASLGTALTADQARLIKRHTKNIFILYDGDKAGELATLRGLELFLGAGLEVKIVQLPKGHDPDSFIRECGVEKFKIQTARAKTLFEYKLALLKEKFDARSVEGKVKIANEMVVLFSKVQNEILRAAWTKELSKELALSEEALTAEMLKSLGKPKPSFEKTEVPASTAAQGPQIAEKLLIGLLLDGGRFVERAKQELILGDFQNEQARSVAGQILQMENADSLAAGLINFYKDEPNLAQIVSIACAEVDAVVDKEKTFEDCLLWLKRSRICLQRENLRSEILEAENRGDKNRIHVLLQNIHELNKGIKKINEKK